MPAAYSRDLRERRLQASDAGLSAAEIAHTLEVSPRSVTRSRARRRQGQSLDPKPIPGRPRTLSPEQDALIVAQVAACPNATLAEHPEQLAQIHGVTVSLWTVARSVRRQGLPLNKSP